jgi:shikimate dehydrogenase
MVRGFRGGVIRGLNVTAPFKERALALSDKASEQALRAGSANVLLFHADGEVEARSTDGLGMMRAFADQALGHDVRSGPAVVLGAGGAARAAASALLDAGCPEIRIVNRTLARAEELVFAFGDCVRAYRLSDSGRALSEAVTLVSAAAGGPAPQLDGLASSATVMDMSYRPPLTGLLRAASARGLKTVDGLAMLIRQAEPSFEAFFGVAPPDADVRAAALRAMRARR